MEIKFLADAKYHLKKAAFWSFTEWHHLYPNETLDAVTNDYMGYLNTKKIPFAIVAIENDNLIGTACCLIEDALPGFDYLSPWLASVYVDPAYRKHGIGKQLINAIINNI